MLSFPPTSIILSYIPSVFIETCSEADSYYIPATRLSLSGTFEISLIFYGAYEEVDNLFLCGDLYSFLFKCYLNHSGFTSG